jgi:hypothetical protein
MLPPAFLPWEAAADAILGPSALLARDSSQGTNRVLNTD